MRVLLVALSCVVALAAGSPIQPNVFDPFLYKLKTTQCRAVDHATGASKMIDIEYLSVNPKAKRTVVLVHGFPSLWSVWGPQILAFSNDFHLIVPNLRGFGKSGFIGNVKTTGTFFDLADDVNCLLGAEKVAQAACVGIDWGTQVCLEAAIFYPQQILAASGTIPYQPSAGTFTPVWFAAELVPTLDYQVYYNNFTSAAIKELDTDIRRTLRATYKTGNDPLPANYLLSTSSYLDCWGNETIPLSTGLMTQHQEDYWVQIFSEQGFKNNLYFYQNDPRVLDFNFTIAHGGATVKQPVLFLPPDKDGVVKDFNQFMEALNAFAFLPNHQTIILNNTGHWVTLEVPDQYNSHLRTWLETVVFV